MPNTEAAKRQKELNRGRQFTTTQVLHQTTKDRAALAGAFKLLHHINRDGDVETLEDGGRIRTLHMAGLARFSTRAGTYVPTLKARLILWLYFGGLKP